MVAKKKVLIFGSTGRLGKRFVEHFKNIDFAYEFLTPVRQEVDLLVPFKVEAFILKHCPDYIINCAALNGIEACEANNDHARLVNAYSPRAMAYAAKYDNSYLIHFSTDYATSQQYQSQMMDEEFTGSPYSFYGKSKRWGEEFVLANTNKNALVLRVASLYDSADMAGSLDAIRQVRSGAGTLDCPVKVLKQYTTPTPTRFAVKKALQLLANYENKLFIQPRLVNVVPRGPVWKEDFARKAVKLFLNKTCHVTTGELANPRPKYSVLDPTRMERMTCTKTPTSLELLEAESKLWHNHNYDNFSPGPGSSSQPSEGYSGNP